MRADRIRAGLRTALVALRTIILLAGGLIYVGYVLAAWPWTRGLSQDVVGFALAPLRGHRPGLRRQHSQARLPGGAVLRHPPAPQAGPAVLRNGGPRRGDALQLRCRLGGADLQDRAGRDHRLRVDRRLSLHPRVGIGGLQGRVAVHRDRLLAGLVVRDLEHHRRLHDDLPPRVQGRRPGQDRRGDGRRDRDAPPGHAPQIVQERRDRDSELADPDRAT